MFDDLSSGAKRTLVSLYKDYLLRIKSGQDITRASYFGGSDNIHKRLLQEEMPENVAHWCRELSRNEYLSCFFADNTILEARLSDKGIRECENRFKGRLVEISRFLCQFIP